jgi:uncharacterized membrane protein
MKAGIKNHSYNFDLHTFYIDKINNDIIVISTGYGNIMSILHIIIDKAKPLIDKISGDKVSIYFDNLLTFGNKSNRFSMLVYDKNTNSVELKKATIPEDKIPYDIKKYIDNFFKKNYNTLAQNSAIKYLSDNQIYDSSATCCGNS